MRLTSDTERVAVLRIKSEIVRAAGAYLREQGFVEILPVLLSPITDPLHHETYGGAVDYYGRPYQLTKSMILHKQIALLTVPRIFCFSPNVRMEPAERASFGRYLAEFIQLDLEVCDATRDDVMAVGEGLVVHVLRSVLERCEEELRILGRDLRVPAVPFERITFGEAAERHGEPFDDALSATLGAPAWVIDFPR
ncbi:asparagine synthetase, partial [Candidatus Bipolaricaulota bacterium]|nr:asparagine synthetase [Candidatus Bipolaricaulota bacterium]